MEVISLCNCWIVVQLLHDLEINDKTGGSEETFPSSVECIDSNKMKIDKLQEVVQPTQRVTQTGRIVKPKIIFDAKSFVYL